MRLRKHSAGFSLVELMISITIGLVVIAGLVSVLMANRQAFTLQQGSNFNQENLRFASARLAWSLRMSDFWGGVKPANITSIATTDGVGGTGGCDAAWVMSVGPGKQNGVFGYSGADSFPIKDCVTSANYVPHTDVLVVRYADTRGYDPAKTSTAAPAYDSADAGVVQNRTSVFVVSGIGQQGTIFRTSQAMPTPPLGVTAGRYVYPYQIEMYYVQPCADPGADAACGTADDGDADSRTPTLVRMRMDETGKLVSEAVVDGIEQMSLEYAGSDGVFASAAGETNWDGVTQVRVAIVARAQSRDTQVPHAAQLVLSGHCAYSVSTAGAVSFPKTTETNSCEVSDASVFGSRPQQFVRSISTQTVLLRNRVRG